MTDRALPYTCAVANRTIDALATHGELALAGEVAIVTRATCDLVHALHREREATTPHEQADARRHRADAEARLRTGHTGADELQATYDHLRALLAARPHAANPRRRHIGFFPSEPA